MSINVEDLKDTQLRKFLNKLLGKQTDLKHWVLTKGADTNWYPDYDKKEYLEQVYLENFIFDDEEVAKFKENLKDPEWVNEFFQECEFNLYFSKDCGVIEIPCK